MNLKTISNDDLHFKTKTLAERERLTTLEVLWHLRENDRRMLYAQMGYRDLREYCVKELKLSEGSAWRRISAMKLLVEVPEIENKIEAGVLNLSQLALARTHFREVKATPTEKRDLLSCLENQNARSTERILAERKPEDFVPKAVESEKPVRGNKVELTLILDEELQAQLEEIQILLGRRHSKLELFKLLAQEKLEKLKSPKYLKRTQQLKASDQSSMAKRKAQSTRNESPQAQTQAQTQIQTQTQIQAQTQAQTQGHSKEGRAMALSRYIPKNVLVEVKKRDQQRCQYVDPVSKRRCGQQMRLQIEHRVPFAKGGTCHLENLELLCPNHNRLRAVQQFGFHKMKKFLPSLN